MKVTVQRVLPGSQLERELVRFIRNCSWEEVKGNLLRFLKNWEQDGRKSWESYFAAVSGGEIIGMISLMKEDYYPLPEIFPWVSCIFVSEPWRGKGVCGQMIDCVNAYAKELGFQRTYIPSIHTGLYEKYGYVYRKDIVNYGGGTDRLYVKDLS